jgi:integrase
MPRPRKDGARAAPPDRRKLTEILIRNLKSKDRAFCTWDTHQRGLALLTQTSGHKSWKVVYAFHGRPRWFHIGDVNAIGLSDARKLAGRIMFQVAEGKDPLAERRAERGKGTFEELAGRYVEEHAKKNNKSWRQADALVRSHLLPRWGKLQAADISRSDVRQMMAKIEAPILANQTLAAASAIFSWGMSQDVLDKNPCQKVERNPTKSRERVLSDSEIPKFWAAFDDAGLVASAALKFILLTGQRPGEVSCMRHEHVADGWWTLPGEPVPELKWPGTKNGASHRVWLPAPARELMAELTDEAANSGFVFAGPRGAAIAGLDQAMRAACAKLNVERATPHDLRRTFSTTVASLGFGREALNRVTNHKEGGIASVYDRHGYADENKRVMEATAAKIMALVTGRADAGKVVVISARARA